MPAKIKAKLPDTHGITERHGRSGEHLLAVVGLEPHSVTHYENGDPPDFTYSLAYIEVAEGDDAALLAQLRARLYAARTGQQALPLDDD